MDYLLKKLFPESEKMDWSFPPLFSKTEDVDKTTLKRIDIYYDKIKPETTWESLSEDTKIEIGRVYNKFVESYNSPTDCCRCGTHPDETLHNIIRGRKGARSLLMPKARVELMNKVDKPFIYR